MKELDGIELLKKVLPGPINEIDLTTGGLPMWANQIAQVVVVTFSLKDHRIALVIPKKQLEFDQLARLQRLVESKLNLPALVVADKINPKYRSLFVRNNVPYIYKDQAIYAPQLGLILNARRQYPIIRGAMPHVENVSIGPFELKILAGFLTQRINLLNFNLLDLAYELKRHDYRCSQGKLSNSINRLLMSGFLTSHGSGPNRKLNFINRSEVWQKLNENTYQGSTRIIPAEFITQDLDLPLSNESALAKYTNLGYPAKPIYAVTNKQLQEIQAEGNAFGDFGNPLFYFDVRKEDPRLFSINGALNPIEVFMDMKDNGDERIQIELSKMLREFNLEDLRDV